MKNFLKNNGFSLAELMIALGVGSIVSLGVVGVFKMKSNQDATRQRESDISAVKYYMENVFSNENVFQNEIVGVNSPVSLNSGGRTIEYSGRTVLASGSVFGKVTVGNIAITEISPLATGSAAASRPALVTIQGSFTKNTNGQTLIGGQGQAQIVQLKLLVSLDSNGRIQGLVSDTNSRTVSLDQSCSNLTGGSNWSPNSQSFKLIDPYDNNIADGLNEIDVTSPLGRCAHDFFRKTCEDFNRSGLVNPYDGSSIPNNHITYNNNETLNWDTRCQNAPEVICLTLGKRWVNGACYDFALTDGTECGPSSSTGESCGRCENKPTCCNGDANCNPADCTCAVCGAGNTTVCTPPTTNTNPSNTNPSNTGTWSPISWSGTCSGCNETGVTTCSGGTCGAPPTGCNANGQCTRSGMGGVCAKSGTWQTPAYGSCPSDSLGEIPLFATVSCSNSCGGSCDILPPECNIINTGGQFGDKAMCSKTCPKTDDSEQCIPKGGQLPFGGGEGETYSEESCCDNYKIVGYHQAKGDGFTWGAQGGAKCLSGTLPPPSDYSPGMNCISDYCFCGEVPVCSLNNGNNDDPTGEVCSETNICQTDSQCPGGACQLEPGYTVYQSFNGIECKTGQSNFDDAIMQCSNDNSTACVGIETPMGCDVAYKQNKCHCP